MKKIKLTRAGVALSMALVAAWWLFSWPALRSLHLRWMRFDEPYAVGYPAVALVVWWVWRHRAALGQRLSPPSWLAVGLFAATLLLGAAAQLVQLMLVQQLVVLGSAWLALVALFGWGAGRLLMFPFVLLALGIPLWDFLVDPLRMMTVWFTEHMTRLFQIPAHIDGFLIGLPTGMLEVAGGCSGLNLFLAMALIGLLFAESDRMPKARRVAIILLAMAIGILDNWIRVFALVLIAHRWGVEHHWVQHHGSLGWWIYAVGLLPYFWLAGKIEHVGVRMSAPEPSPPHSGVDAAPSSVPAGMFMVALLLLIVVGSRHFEARRGMAEHGFTAPAGALPLPVAKAWLPTYAGHDVAQAWQLMRGGVVYEVVALTYIEQRNDKKLIYYSNRIADEHALLDSGYLSVAPGFGVNTTLVQGNPARLVWWYWWVDGSVSTGALNTKLLQLRAMLVGDPSAALVAVSVACGDECAAVQAQASEDVLQLLGELRDLRIER